MTLFKKCLHGVCLLVGLAVSSNAGAEHKPEKAAAVLTPLGNDPHNPDRAKRVQKAIEAIKARKNTGEVMKLLAPSA